MDEAQLKNDQANAIEASRENPTTQAIKRYTYRLSAHFNPLRLHCCLTHLLGKGQDATSARVSVEGKKLIIYSAKEISKAEVKLYDKTRQRDIVLKYVEEDPVEIVKHSPNSNVSVSTVVSYGRSKTGKKGRFCPVKGQSVTDMPALLEFIKNNMGLTADKETIVVNELSAEGLDYKVKPVVSFNCFALSFKAVVTDAHLANSLSHRAVGQKKSYGYGNVRLKAA